MEILKNSPFVESTNREIASQPQARTLVLAVPLQREAALWPVEHGELVITVVKGRGEIRGGSGEHELTAGDQVYLVGGDEFALSAAGPEEPFVVRMYWSPVVRGPI
jgi:quercetin dioxygenase-like cupin family protein